MIARVTKITSWFSFQQSQDTNENRFKKIPIRKTASTGSSMSTTSSSTCPIKVLMLILHGGNPLETSPDIKSKENDCERLRREFQNVMENHYKEGLGHIEFRLVECPHLFKDVLPALKDINPLMTGESAGGRFWKDIGSFTCYLGWDGRFSG